MILSGLGVVFCAALILAAMRFWFRPPDLSARQHTTSLEPKVGGALDLLFQNTQPMRPGYSGIHIIDDDREAFAVRRDVIRLAESSIDAQYYMWHADLTGRLLLAEALQAADRGVRVRLLLDDNTTAGTDLMLLAANSHPNVEVRLFNPFMLRKPRTPSYLFDFRRVNRRMHNKSLTVDGTATIVGGRNIGDEYFSAHADFRFADMDVLAIGPVVADVAKSFDSYWNSASSFPLQSVVTAIDVADKNSALFDLPHLSTSENAETYTEAVKEKSLSATDKPLNFEWVPVQLVVDDPSKGRGNIPRRKLLVTGLQKSLGEAETSIDVLTAYFVPGRNGVNFLSRAVKSGKTVRVLTNSLASNDVVPVHAGYARYRKRMLRRGIGLHELRPTPQETPRPSKFKKKIPRFGASSSSLHAKIFVMDQQRVFVGSFNFDPRSLYLNCEMGLMIDSRKLGTRVTAQINQMIESRTYQPFLDFGGRLSWRDSEQRLFRMEPESTAQQRIGAWLISWLPIEWLL